MGFFSKLKKVLPEVNKAAILGATLLPGKAGRVAGQVAEGTGVVTTIVQQMPDGKTAALAAAVAIDDHEGRVKALEAELAELREKLKEQGQQ